MASQPQRHSAPQGAFGSNAAQPEQSGEHPLAEREPLRSGAFPAGGSGDPESPFEALAPYYRPRGEVEHATLEIPDRVIGEPTMLSASSLVPPSDKPFPFVRAAAVLLVLGLGVAAGVALTAQPERATVPRVAPVVAPVIAAAPAVEAPTAAADEVPTAAPAVEAITQRAQQEAEAVQPQAAPLEAADDSPRRSVGMAQSQPRRSPRRSLQAAAPEPTAEPSAQAPEAPPAQLTEAPPTPSAAAEPQDALALTLPTTPSREQITAGFTAVRPKLVECAGGVSGVASAEVTIAGSGKVRYAVVGGDFNGSAAGSCMARALRTATFPQFARASIQVEYPFAL